MKMKTIRKAEPCELAEIMAIYADARLYMRASGNREQWSGGYPSEEIVRDDMKKESLFVCEEDGELLGVFYFAKENDPTYAKIYDGAWLNDEPYAVIHRIAVSKNSHGKGVAAFIFQSCFEQYSNLKIDTHRDNIPMQKALFKNGFIRCGIIYLANGDERIAFQKAE